MRFRPSAGPSRCPDRAIRNRPAPRRSLLLKKLADAVTEERAKHPDRPVEVFATDEHRIGLKPILRRIWAPKGERPLAFGHHRYEWLYVTAFVSPTTGETVWFVSDGICKPLFEGLLDAFAKETGAGERRIIVLVLDNAGWHTEPGLAVPEGLRLVYLPPYSPELQPAECLWELIDEPLVNRHFDCLADLHAAVDDRCRYLQTDPDKAKAVTNFHWWPGIPNPT